MEADSAGSDKHFVCDYCPKKYLRKNNLEDHILMEHPDTEQVRFKAELSFFFSLIAESRIESR